MDDPNTKTDWVYYVLKMNLKCASNEATKWIKTSSFKYTKDLEEEKSLSFEWFLSVDGKEATLIESFSDSDNAKQRAENLLANPIAQSGVKDLSPLIGLWAEV